MTREQRRKSWPPKFKALAVRDEERHVIAWKTLRQEIKSATRRSLKALAASNHS